MRVAVINKTENNRIEYLVDWPSDSLEGITEYYSEDNWICREATQNDKFWDQERQQS
jgi:hypothetical protein